MSFYSPDHPPEKLLTAFWPQITFLAVAGIPNQLPGIKFGPKNAAYFRAKTAITFEPDIPPKSNRILSIAWVMTIP